MKGMITRVTSCNECRSRNLKMPRFLNKRRARMNIEMRFMYDFHSFL